MLGFECVSPTHPAVVDLPGELAAGIRCDHPAPRLPRPLREFIATGEPRADAWAVSLVPPAGAADRTPVAHPRHIRHQRVQLIRCHGHGNRIRQLQLGHGPTVIHPPIALSVPGCEVGTRSNFVVERPTGWATVTSGPRS